MKVLFFVGALNEKLNASNKIAVEIAKGLSAKGIYCVAFGINDSADFEYSINDNLKIVSKARFINPQAQLEQYVKNSNFAARSKAVKSFMLKHPITAVKIGLSYKFPKWQIANLLDEARSIFNDFYKQNSFDYVIAFHEPAWTVPACEDCECKKIIYQLDPYGLHEIFDVSHQKQKIETELKSFKRAYKIFTTPVLYEQYLCNDKYHLYKDKLIPVEFPNIIRRNTQEQNVIKFDESYINVVFCGILDDWYRSPESFLLFIEEKLISERIRIYFIGDIVSEYASRIIPKYPNNIFIYPRVDLNTAVSIQADADFLLNFGNNITNQVPSKIFDYFSQGKPIISVQKICDDPSLAYLKKYPLAFLYNEFESDNSIEELINFLKQYKNSHIAFDEIEAIFKECTPNYVCGKILNVLVEPNEKTIKI